MVDANPICRQVDCPVPVDHLHRPRALSLWQPWASLIAVGAKTIETRGWSTTYRGPLLIHAAATIDGVRTLEFDYEDGWTVGALNDTPHVFCRQRIDGEMVVQRYTDGDGPHPLPLGAVVAVCTLADVVPIEELGWTGLWVGWAWQGANGSCERHSSSAKDPAGGRRVVVNADQRPYGDFAPGRYAWLLADVRPLTPPVPAQGRQGLWAPDDDLILAIEDGAAARG